MDRVIFNQLFLFEGLTTDQLNDVCPLFEPCDFAGGTVLFEQGDPAEFLYAVISGEVIVRFKPDDGPVITVAQVRSGSIVGWSAVLGSRRYTSGAECSEATQLLRVKGDALRQLCIQHPETGVQVLDRLATVIAERLRSTHDMVLSLIKLGLKE